MDIPKNSDISLSVFNGNGYTIKNLTIKDDNFSRNYAGLFGYIAAYTLPIPCVADLAMENVNIQINTKIKSLYVGSIAGAGEYSSIRNCYSSYGSINVKVDPVVDSATNIDPTVNTSSYYCMGGGLVGCLNASYSDLNYCYNLSDVKLNVLNNGVDGMTLAGGICGSFGVYYNNTIGYEDSQIRNCFNAGDIEARGADARAHFIDTPCGISHCANLGRISSYSYKGHIYGKATGISGAYTDSCYNIGEIYAQGDVETPPSFSEGVPNQWTYSGGKAVGLGGDYDYLVRHYNFHHSSYNIGTVHSSMESWSYCPITNPKIQHSITRNESHSAVPISGNSAASFYLNNESHYIYQYCEAVPLSIPQLTNKSSFVGFDFENIWDIRPDKNNGRPFLRNLLPGLRESSVQPIEPDTAMGKHESTAIPLKLNTVTTAESSSFPRCQIFHFTPTQTADYVLETLGNTDITFRIYTLSNTGYETSFDGSTLTAGQKYYLKAYYYGEPFNTSFILFLADKQRTLDLIRLKYTVLGALNPENGKEYDFNGDGAVDVFDLTATRREKNK